MFGNRTVCGIGRGDSSRRVLGRPPTTLAETEEAMHVIKELAEGRAIETPAGEVRIPWVRDGRLEVWMAAYGPKALALVGRKADGFILQLADPDITRWTVAKVREAAVEAGRDPDAITVCVAAPAYVGDDLAHQREQCRWFGGMVGNHVADIVKRYGEGGDIPRALTDYIKAREGYDYSHHGRVGNPDTEFVPDEIVERFCVLGTVDDHVAKLRELEGLGVDQFNIYLMHDALDATMDAYGREIIPQMARHHLAHEAQLVGAGQRRPLRRPRSRPPRRSRRRARRRPRGSRAARASAPRGGASCAGRPRGRPRARRSRGTSARRPR